MIQNEEKKIKLRKRDTVFSRTISFKIFIIKVTRNTWRVHDNNYAYMKN